jgi:hypothetical protein
MIASRYVRLPIHVGSSWRRYVYFYQTQAGLWDAQFHWSYTSRMHDSLPAAVGDFITGLSRAHDLVRRGLVVRVGEPVDTNWGEVSAVRRSIQAAAEHDCYFNGP